jgi:hypothetical protein
MRWILARHAGITKAEDLVDIAFDAYGDDSISLNETRDDYLTVARQALARERRRQQTAKQSRGKPIP